MSLRNQLFLFLYILFAGVSCATPEKRIEQHPALFEGLDSSTQAAVLDGRIGLGFTEAAVYLALGEPASKKIAQFKGNEVDSWVYTEIETSWIPSYRYSAHTSNNGGVVLTQELRPQRHHHTKPSMVVFFEEGSVIGWQDWVQNGNSDALSRYNEAKPLTEETD